MAKITICVDDSTLISFKTLVLQKHGTLRNLSKEVEKLLESAIVENQLVQYFENIGITARGTISSSEVKATRPKLKGPPSEKILRKTRKN